MLIQAGSTTANVKNNLGYAPSASAPVLLLDSGTGTARGSNSSDA